jgi:hypothetical protein
MLYQIKKDLKGLKSRASRSKQKKLIVNLSSQGNLLAFFFFSAFVGMLNGAAHGISLLEVLTTLLSRGPQTSAT